MIKMRYGLNDVTIRKVTVIFDKHIEDILLEYVGRRKAGIIIKKLKEIENESFIIAEIYSAMFELKICHDLIDGDIPTFERINIEEQILDCMIKNGLKLDEAEECLPLIYSLEEVPETSNEETAESSQGEAETLGT